MNFFECCFLGIKNRFDIDSRIKSEFIAKVKRNNIKLIIHWDGKLMSNTTNGSAKQLVDRLPVICTGKGVCQVLGIPKLDTGTGQVTADAVYEIVDEWGLWPYVIGLCFDTTRSNTGSIRGAVTLLGHRFLSPKLTFECRHHVAELYVGAAFETIFGKSGKLNKEFRILKEAFYVIR